MRKLVRHMTNYTCSEIICSEDLTDYILFYFVLWTYLLLEHLPTESECVQAIVNVSPSYGSQKQKDTIHNFACSLHNMWVKSFTEKHVITLKYVKVKLTDQVKIYVTKVQKAKGNK